MNLIPFEGRRVAIIGGAGFIGHHLALDLAVRGAQVTVIDSLEVNNLVAVMSDEAYAPNRELSLRVLADRLHLMREAGVIVIAHDARDYRGLENVMGDIAPQVVVHAAGVAHADRSNTHPVRTFDHSLRTLQNTLDVCRDEIEHFIYLSSSMVYGNFATPVVDEDHPLNPMGIYGALKVAGEKIVTAYQQVFQMPTTIIRPSALYGPRCVSRRVGQIFIENAAAGLPITVWDGGLERLDFTYVGDLVGGLIRVIEHPAARNQTFNLTFGAARQISDLVEIVRDEFPDVVVDDAPRARFAPRRGTLSIERARALIEYAPRHALEDGMREYLGWYRRFASEGAVGAGRADDR